MRRPNYLVSVDDVEDLEAPRPTDWAQEGERLCNLVEKAIGDLHTWLSEHPIPVRLTVLDDQEPLEYDFRAAGKTPDGYYVVSERRDNLTLDGEAMTIGSLPIPHLFDLAAQVQKHLNTKNTLS